MHYITEGFFREFDAAISETVTVLAVLPGTGCPHMSFLGKFTLICIAMEV